MILRLLFSVLWFPKGAEAALPAVPFLASVPQLPRDVEEQLVKNNLYGELSGYAIPVSHHAKGFLRFDLTSWMDGSVFDAYIQPVETKLRTELNVSANFVGELDYLHLALKENIKMQKDLLVKEVNQQLERYATITPERTARRPRSGTAVLLIKDIALSAIEYLVNFIWGRMKEKDQQKYREETARLLNEQLFRTKVHLILTHVREEAVATFNRLLTDLFHHNRLAESLYMGDESLQRAIATFLGDYYPESIFMKYGEKALHAARVEVLNIDLKRKCLDVEVDVPVALVHEMQPVVHVVDLGYFTGNASFGYDLLPEKFLFSSPYPSDWPAIGGPCTPIGSLSVCESVSLPPDDCKLDISSRTGCKRASFPLKKELTLVRRMTQGYVVATTSKQATHHFGDSSTSLLFLNASVFSVRIAGDEELEVGEHRLKGIGDYWELHIQYGRRGGSEETNGIVAHSLMMRPGPVPWTPILGAGLLLLFGLLLVSHMCLLRKMRSRRDDLGERRGTEVSEYSTISTDSKP